MNEYTKLLFSINKISAIISRKFHFNGIDLTDYIILSQIDEAKNKRLNRIELAQKTGLSPSGITRILKPLEKRGIIKSSEDTYDARIKNASLTDAGKNLLAEADYSLEIITEDLASKQDLKISKATNDALESMAEDYFKKEEENEVEKKWTGTKALEQSKERMKKLSKEDLEKIKTDTNNLTQEIAEASDAGVKNDKVQTLIAKHYKNINIFYECSLEMYLDLGEMYVKDQRFASYYNNFKPGFSRFMRNAIKEFYKNNKPKD